MTPTEQKLNEWLSANGQDAIKNLAQQGLTLRFVHGPENYHQERPSLLVEAEGVGFSFQQNFCHGMSRAQMLDNAVAKAPAMREAFDHARQQYQSNGLPLQGGSVQGIIQGEPHRGAGWDICNHQTTCSTYVRDLQEQRVNDFYRPIASWDAVKQVKLLCETKRVLENIDNPEFIVALSRHAYTVRAPEGHDMQLTFHEGMLGIRFDYEEGAVEATIRASLYHRAGHSTDYFRVGSAMEFLDHDGVSVDNAFGQVYLNTAITAKDLNMDPLVMNTMADMGVAPLDILRFDAQKADAETSAGEDYLQSMDGDIFASDSTEQGFMR